MGSWTHGPRAQGMIGLTIAVPAVAGEFTLSGLLEVHNMVLALDEARGGIDHHGEGSHVPQWLMEAEDAWALVPLIHFDRLVGVIVLARPRNPRQLDWEDFDLLRVAGQQLASYLAEQAGQQALMDASRFDEFNRRMAFVMHDIKNLVSQLSLLAANMNRHVYSTKAEMPGTAAQHEKQGEDFRDARSKHLIIWSFHKI